MNYPKVQLHCHLDGAFPNDLFVRYCREDGLLDESTTDEEWIKANVMNETMTLSECMGEFAILTGLLQKEERLEELSFEVLKRMYESGTRIAEIRFSPQSHINDHMDMEDAVKAVLRGRQRVLELYPDYVCGVILCMMNLGQNLGTVENNTKIVHLAKKYLDQGVVAIDLAGDELATPIESYKAQFDLAKELKVPFTIHAGESGPASNVRFALSLKGGRIGHGIHCENDDELIDQIVASNTLLEISVTSNVFSQCVESLDAHPIRKLYDRGVMINVNTDDPGLMGIDLDHEYDVLRKHFGFTERDLILCNLYSARASFCGGKEKIVAELTQALRECNS